MLASASDLLAENGVLIYIGINRPIDGSDVDGMPPEILATRDDLRAELPDLIVERSEIICRTIGYPGGSFSADLIVVKARKSSE